MAKEINFNINVNADDAEDSIKKIMGSADTLKKKYRELMTAAQNAMDPKVAEKYIKAAGEVKDSIGDIDQRITQMASDTQKLDLVVGSVQGLAGAFATVQGVMALTGSENEKFEETMKKVTGSIAVLNGVQQVANTLNKDSVVGKRLHAAANILLEKTQKLVNSGLSTMKKALISTGVGAFVVALGMLIANFEDISNWLKKIIPGFESFGESLTKIWNSITDFLGFTSKEGREAVKVQEELVDLNDKIYKQQQDNLEILKASGAEQQTLDNYEKSMYEDRLKRLDEIKKLRGEATKEELEEQQELVKKLNLLNIKIDTDRKKSIQKRNEEAQKLQLEAEKKALDIAKASVESIKKNIEETNINIEKLEKTIGRLTRDYLKEGFDKDIQVLSSKLKDTFDDAISDLIKESNRINDLIKNNEEQQKKSSGDVLKTLREESDKLSEQRSKLQKEISLLRTQFYIEESILVSDFYQASREQYQSDLESLKEANAQKQLDIANFNASVIVNAFERLKATSMIEEELVKLTAENEIKKTKELDFNLVLRKELTKNYQKEVERELELNNKRLLESTDENEKRILRALIDVSEKKLANIKLEIDTIIELQQSYSDNRVLIEKQLQNILKSIQDKYFMDQLSSIDKMATAAAEGLELITNLSTDITELQMTKANEAYKKDLTRLNSYLEQKLITQEEYNKQVEKLEATKDKAARKAFETQKKIDIATTTIDTILTAIKTFKSFVETFGGPVGIPLGVAASGLVLASGLAQVNKIKQTTYDNPSVISGGGSNISVGGGNLSNPFTGTPSTNITATGITEKTGMDTRVYVVESDISKVQNRVKVVERNANAPF